MFWIPRLLNPLALVVLLVVPHGQTITFHDVSNVIEKRDGVVAAFADFDGDRRTDIFMIDKSGKSVVVIQLLKDGTSTRESLVTASEPIRSVVPADFNGDSRVDLLVLTSAKPGGPYKTHVSYMELGKTKMGSLNVVGTFPVQPLVLDWNGDMIADLYTQTTDGKRSVFISSKASNFTETKIATPQAAEWASPGYSAFVDVNGDYQPDLVIRVKGAGNEITFQVILAENGKWDHTKAKLVTLKGTYALVGQPVFGDYNFDSFADMLLPVCEDANCDKSHIFMFTGKSQLTESSDVTPSLNVKDADWTLVPVSDNPVGQVMDLPQVSGLSPGDVNLDMWPDCAVVLRKKGTKGLGTARVALLINDGKAKFHFEFAKGLLQGNASHVGFFDLNEDGVMDLVASSVEGTLSKVSLYNHVSTGDAYFLKVMVLSGQCGDPGSCPAGHLPYGLPVPGPVVTYDTEGIEGGRLVTSVTMVPQTGFLALPLPFHTFGLGPFANYIEKLTVTLPFWKTTRSHQFNFIVPKTQLIVIPSPLDAPSKWKTRLFLEPFYERKVLYVAAALLGTCVLVILIAAGLQWAEIMADKQEKLQEAQKFNFDAM